ncbi:T9SS type A sorting domain-containing protein [Ulvibacter litoralis]|uniref:Por secretion system C-terminal sorting domain-containing protein n=1 Tax=Ulvibacter litoralis TaxID=227084 RepID=A0A1G7FWZ8_9FLAO|nr:fibronectin type III domain-containing protein [Ulvibacter litoralis]GHC64444.1 hypothetical protein GCM10008083_32120 [Ulvibacter litoralis]SDE80302.1 Por secretion system C-terminal sorting domain-containing protein [Ulvibacter litoralis]
MKKITCLIFGFALLITGWQTQAQLVEDFESVTIPNLPGGWVNEVGSGSDSGNSWASTNVRVNSGSQALFFDDFSGDNDVWVISQAMDLSGVTNPQLTYFDNVNYRGSAEVHDVLYSTDYSGGDPSSATWTLLNDIFGTEDTWIENGPYFLESSTTVYVAFHYTGNYDSEWYIDDVTIAAGPSCLPVTALTVTNETTTGADINWILGDSETDWEYVVQAAGTGEPTGSGISVGSTSVTVNTLAPDTDYEVYVRADCGSEFSSWTGPVTFTTLISCPAPTALTVTGVTTTSVDLSWTLGSTESAWDITYGAPGFDPETEGTTFNDADGTSTETISGLTAATTYDVYVRSVCGSSDLSVYSSKVSFTTSCTAVTSFVQNFDAISTPAFPTCWGKVGASGSASTQTSNNNSVPNALYMYSSSTSNLAVVKMQPVSNVGDGTHRLRFNMRANFTVGGVVEFGYLTDSTDATSFVSLGSATAASTTYAEYIITPSAGTFTNDIALRHTGSPSNSLLIDDVTWEEIPACLPPINLTVSNITAKEAEINWTLGDTETDWEYVVQEAVLEAPSSGTPINGSSSVTVVELLPETDYEVYVRANCISEYSTWVGPVNFTTLISCPIVTDFAIEGLTTTTVDLSWTAGGSETAWDIIYGATDFDPVTEGTTFSDTDGTATETISGLTADTAYDFYIKAICGVGDESQLVGPMAVYTGYCIPSGASHTGSYIDNFSTTGGDPTNINNLATGYGTDGYQDNYDTMSITSYELGAFDFSTTTVGNTVGVAIWVDWNNDLLFETAERVYNSASYVTSPSGTITVPSGTLAGDYRMRVLIDYNRTSPQPCSFNSGRGEAEDYKLTIAAPPACLQVSNPIIDSMTDISAEASWDVGIVTAEYEWLVVASGDGPTGTVVADGATALLNTSITGLTAETAYDFYVKADCETDYVGPVTFTTNPTPPVNDTCAGAIDLASETSPLTASITNSTTATEDISCLQTAGRDLFYQILVPDAYEFSFNQISNTFDSVHRIAYGTSCPGDIELYCSDYGETTVTNWTNTTGADQTIYIVIEGYNDSTRGDFTMQWSLVAPPDCPDVENVSTITNPDASVSLNWDDVVGAAGYDYEIQPQGIAQGTVGALLAASTGTSDATVASGVLTDGNDYTIYVRSDCGSGFLGNFQSFDFSYMVPPSNISCASASTLVYGQTIVQNSTGSTATSEGIGCSMGVNGLWYSFVGNGGDVTVSSEAVFDHRMAIGSGACGALTNIICDDQSTGVEDHTFTTILNETYYIYIAHYSSGNTSTGDMYVTLTGGDNIWDGTSWSLGTPTVEQNAVIAAPYDTSIGDEQISFEAGSLVINSTQTLMVAAGDYIDIAGDITVDGDLIVANTGSVVQRFDTALTFNEGTTTVEKITPNLDAQSFMILGSPMTAETREDVYSAAYIVRNHNTANFIPNPDVANDFPSAENFADDNGNNWLDHVGTINPAEGYMVFPQANSTGSGVFTHNYTEGTLNSGEITIPLAYHTDQNSSPNMLSNPYASAIDADAFYANPANSDIDVLYFWEHITPLSTSYPGYQAANFNMADISMYSESMGGIPAGNGGTTPTSIISSGQGFAVKAASAGINATFNNTMRVTGPNDTYRRPITSERDRLWINVFNDTYGLGSTTLIGFSENTTDAFEVNADIKRLATPVSLYSELSTGQELAINALGSFEIEDAVALSFSTQVKESQNYRISLQEIDGLNIEEAIVFLIDNQLGTVTNLTEGDYTFQSEEGTYSERFKVVFQNRTLNISDIALNSVSVYPNPTQNILYIVSPKVAVTGVAVFDLRGRKVSKETFTAQRNYQVDLNTLESAMYFVEITTENGKITKRVIKE